MKGFVKASITTAALGIALAAPDSEFAVPVIGYVYDAAPREVRPLTGAPGAATVGAGVGIGEFDKVLTSGDGSFALVSSADTVRVLRFGSAGVEPGSIENVTGGFDKGALSPSGTSAVLYSAACQCVRVITDLRTTPRLARTIALAGGSELGALAVDDGAGAIALSADKVFLYTRDSETPVAELPFSAEALAFDAAGQRLLAIEKAARKLHLVSNLGQSPTLTELLSEREGLANPAAAAFAANGTILVADADAGVLVWNEAERTVRRFECLCKPSLLDRTATQDLYRLSGLEGGAVWLLDLSAETPRTFFVPAPRVEESK